MSLLIQQQPKMKDIPLSVPDQPHVDQNLPPHPQSKYQRAALHYITIITLSISASHIPTQPRDREGWRKEEREVCEGRKEDKRRGYLKKKQNDNKKETKNLENDSNFPSPHTGGGGGLTALVRI